MNQCNLSQPANGKMYIFYEILFQIKKNPYSSYALYHKYWTITQLNNLSSNYRLNSGRWMKLENNKYSELLATEIKFDLKYKDWKIWCRIFYFDSFSLQFIKLICGSMMPTEKKHLIISASWLQSNEIIKLIVIPSLPYILCLLVH